MDPSGQVEVIPKHLEDITEEAGGSSAGGLGWLQYAITGWMIRPNVGIVMVIRFIQSLASVFHSLAPLCHLILFTA